MVDKRKTYKGKRKVITRYIRRNGKVIYPKNASVFVFWVDEV